MAVAMATTTVSWSSSLSFSSSSLFSSNCNGNNKLKPFKSSKSKSNPIRASQTTSDLLPPLPVLSASGEKLGEAHLRLKSAPPDTARAVVHRGIITDLQNRRRGTASTLTRAEVRGGGKKPFPQKKLGRARRGSQRTPLRPGGGVIFGPKPKDWSIKINRKEKRLAISTAIASAVKAMDALVIDDEQQTFSSTFPPKTKDFIATMKMWGLDPAQKTTFLMMEVPENVRLSGRNVPTVKMLTPRTLNLFDVLNANKLVFTRGALDYLNSIYGALEDEFDDAAGGYDEQVLEEQPKQEEEQPAGNEGVAVERSTSTD